MKINKKFYYIYTCQKDILKTINQTEKEEGDC